MANTTNFPMLIITSTPLRDGINYTIRCGLRWVRNQAIGSKVMIACKTGKGEELKEIGPAEIKVHVICKLKDIPQFVYDNEHDSSLKDKKSTIKILEGFYLELSEEANKENIIVSCLGFEMLDKKVARK